MADLYHAFLGHYNLFQAIEKHETPEQTSANLQKVIEWLKELIQVNEYEPELKSEIFICYEGQKVQVVAKTKSQKLYISKWRSTRELCIKNATIWLHVCVLQMANIRMLKEYAETEASIYAAFKATRIEDRNQLQKPFDQLSPNEVTPTLLKWLCEREGRRVTVQLRMLPKATNSDPNNEVLQEILEERLEM